MLVRVVKIMDFGAFVEMPNGLQALLHVSELEKRRVSRFCVILADTDDEIDCHGMQWHKKATQIAGSGIEK